MKMDANKTKAFSEGGGETGSMYVLSYEVRWYVHIIYNQWYVHVPRSVQSVWYVNIPRSVLVCSRYVHVPRSVQSVLVPART